MALRRAELIGKVSERYPDKNKETKKLAGFELLSNYNAINEIEGISGALNIPYTEVFRVKDELALHLTLKNIETDGIMQAYSAALEKKK